MIVIGIASPDDAAKADQRDKEINRLGEYVGGIVARVGMIVPFGLAIGRVRTSSGSRTPCTWASSSGRSCGDVVKLVAYRRGF